jgi:hypothetical protein
LLKFSFIDRATLLPTINAPKVFVYRQGEKETTYFRISADRNEPATQIRKLGGCPPHVIDHKVAITEAQVVGHEQLNRRVEMFQRVSRRGVDCGQTIPVQPHAGVNAFGERFGKCRFADSEWPV